MENAKNSESRKANCHFRRRNQNIKISYFQDGTTDPDEVIDFKQKMKLWNELMEETNKLSDDYHALIDEMKEMRKISIKAIYGGGLRYKIVRLLMK